MVNRAFLAREQLKVFLAKDSDDEEVLNVPPVQFVTLRTVARPTAALACTAACIASAAVAALCSTRSITLTRSGHTLSAVGLPDGAPGAANATPVAPAGAAPGRLNVTGLCSRLHCANGGYVRKGYLKDGHAWYEGGLGEDGCWPEWIYYDPDPRRDHTVPAQWVFYGTQRAPWARGEPKTKPQWDNREYKLPPEQDYQRHAYFVPESADKSLPMQANWKQRCMLDDLGTWDEARIQIMPQEAGVTA